MKENQIVPLWKEFKELASDLDLDKVNVEYLPPIPFHQPIWNLLQLWEHYEETRSKLYFHWTWSGYIDENSRCDIFIKR